MPKRMNIMSTSTSKSTPRGARSAFTLIELLVVIAIIAILAAILFPVFARARENARRASCESNLKQIGLGIFQYTQDYDEKFPAGYIPTSGTNVPWAVVVQPYVKSVQLFRCPSNTSPTANFMNGSDNTIPLSYLANGGGDNGYYGGRRPMTTNLAGDGPTAIASVDSVAQVILVSEMGVRPDGNYRSDPTVWSNTNDLWMQNHLGTSNFLFADGHVKSLKPVATGAPLNMWNIKNTTTNGGAAPGPADTALAASLGTIQSSFN